MKQNFYALILKMALEYRLSLENLCIILGIEATQDNQEKIYNIFEALFNKNTDLKVLYDFLFMNETKNEEDETSLQALNAGYLFFSKYKIANKNRDNEMINELMTELDSLDSRIKSLKNRNNEYELTDNDYLDIFKYKVKYCLSRAELSNILNISSAELIKKELGVTDKKLKRKLNLLNKKQIDIVLSRTKAFNVDNILNASFNDYDNKLMEMCYKQK